MPNGKTRLEIIVEGKVQGVFFRAGASEMADKLGLTGYTRNLENGKVEVVAEGERQKLEKFLEWCAKGPEGAVVESIRYEWSDYSGNFDSFKIRRD